MLQSGAAVDDLHKLLTSVRTHYVGMFENALKELREKGHKLIVEPPMVDEAGALAREGVFNAGSRHDLAIEENGAATPSMFQPGKMLKFEPVAFHGAGLNIAVSPFRWDGVQIAIDGDPVKVAAILADWFENALCAPEGVAEDGLQHAAHFISDPVVDGGTSIVQADLGTVDVALVIYLIDQLRLAGASRVEVGMAEG